MKSIIKQSFRLLLKLLFCSLCVSVFLGNLKARSDFEQLGDILTLAPVGVFVISMGMQDYKGGLQLALGSLSTQASIEGIKSAFQSASKKGYPVKFARRPCCENNYKGMPSGHAGGSFSAAGFVYYRYGWEYSLPLVGLGVVTAASRVSAKKHSIPQVIAGGAIAWGWAYLFTSPYKASNFISITPDIGFDSGGEEYYGLNFSMRF